MEKGRGQTNGMLKVCGAGQDEGDAYWDAENGMYKGGTPQEEGL